MSEEFESNKENCDPQLFLVEKLLKLTISSIQHLSDSSQLDDMATEMSTNHGNTPFKRQREEDTSDSEYNSNSKYIKKANKTKPVKCNMKRQ